jgi:hypothetical protein
MDTAQWQEGNLTVFYCQQRTESLIPIGRQPIQHGGTRKATVENSGPSFFGFLPVTSVNYPGNAQPV